MACVSLQAVTNRGGARDFIPEQPRTSRVPRRPQVVEAIHQPDRPLGFGTRCRCLVKMLLTDLIGWFSAAVLVLTIGRQVWTQWRTRSSQGLSKWLFVGQVVASTGFVVYSFLVGNWVFVATNLVMLLIALVGQGLYLHNRRRASRSRTSVSVAG